MYRSRRNHYLSWLTSFDFLTSLFWTRPLPGVKRKQTYLFLINSICIIEVRSHSNYRQYKYPLHCSIPDWIPGSSDRSRRILEGLAEAGRNPRPPPPIPSLILQSYHRIIARSESSIYFHVSVMAHNETYATNTFMGDACCMMPRVPVSDKIHIFIMILPSV